MTTKRVPAKARTEPSANALAVAMSSQRPRTSDRSSQVEQAVFAAAEKLLATTTARDLSVAQILEAANVSRATFYHYFGSKWEVVNYLAASVMQEIWAQVQVFASGVAEGDPAMRRAALREGIENGCRTWASHRAVLRAVLDHWRDVPELRSLLTEILIPFQVGLAAQVDAERAAGNAPAGPDSSSLVAALLWSSLSCLQVASLPDVEQIADEEEAATLLVAIWLGTLYGHVPEG